MHREERGDGGAEANAGAAMQRDGARKAKFSRSGTDGCTTITSVESYQTYSLVSGLTLLCLCALTRSSSRIVNDRRLCKSTPSALCDGCHPRSLVALDSRSCLAHRSRFRLVAARLCLLSGALGSAAVSARFESSAGANHFHTIRTYAQSSSKTHPTRSSPSHSSLQPAMSASMDLAAKREEIKRKRMERLASTGQEQQRPHLCILR